MIFSDLYKSPKSPFTKLRGSLPPTAALASPEQDPDLVSKDKGKQKEAVRKFLAEKIRNDWDFPWPPPPTSTASLLSPTELPIVTPVTAAPEEGTELPVSPAPVIDEDGPNDAGEVADSESGEETEYSIVSDDQLHFRARAEWTSDLSDDDHPSPAPSPFRFDSPDTVGTVVQATLVAKRRCRRKALRDEMQWNQGLACYEARRQAWTGAKTVRVKPKPPSPVSPSSPRRLFWRHYRAESNASNPPAPGTIAQAMATPLSPTATSNSQRTASPPLSDQETLSNASSVARTGEGNSASSANADGAHPTVYSIETLIPVPPPLLPPQNPMRASVTPSIYPSLYDKIVVHSLQPSCPVNLSDMLRACVVGWKRDGEWPPRSAVLAAPPVPTPTYAALAVRAHRKAKNQAAAAARQEQAQRSGTPATSSPRRMSFGALLGRADKEKNGDGPRPERRDSHADEDAKGIRKSLQKVFSLGHTHAGTAQ